MIVKVVCRRLHMVGVQNSQKDLFSYNINLDKRVRRDHPLRQIAAKIDFTYVREEVAHCYGKNGTYVGIGVCTAGGYRGQVRLDPYHSRNQQMKQRDRIKALDAELSPQDRARELRNEDNWERQPFFSCQHAPMGDPTDVVYN